MTMDVTIARIRSVPRRLAAQVLRRMPPPSIGVAPANPRSWIASAHKHLAILPERTVALIDHHELTLDSSVIAFFQAALRKHAGPRLRTLAALPMAPSTIADAIDEIVRWKTIIQCTHAHRAGGYFSEAEKVMQVQWDSVIWPIIKDEDFRSVLELACGHGRNTELLRHRANHIDLVDVNETCIDACRARFGSKLNGCEFSYHLTTGNGLPMISSSSISFGYSWDSMVHFDKLVVRDYVKEFARILKPGASAFLHHSNLGAISPNSDWAKNHGNRSDMSAELMQKYASEAGLSIKFQRLSGMSDGWGMDDLDCLSLLQKPVG